MGEEVKAGYGLAGNAQSAVGSELSMRAADATQRAPAAALGTQGSVLRRLVRQRRNIPIFLALGVVALIMLFGQLIAPYNASIPDYTSRLQHPSVHHLLGTDELGRDLFSRILVGTRISLGAALIAEVIVVTVGAVVGLVAGFYGGLVDTVVMRVTDIFMAFPSLLLAIAVAAFLGPSLRNTIIAVSFSWWPYYARLMRSQVLAKKEEEYVFAARALGAGTQRLMFTHIVPNCLTPIIVQLTISIGGALVVIAGLSFLGLGVRPPTPEWGALIFSGFRYVLVAPWYCIAPGAAIVIVVMIFSAAGDALQDVFR